MTGEDRPSPLPEGVHRPPASGSGEVGPAADPTPPDPAGAPGMPLEPKPPNKSRAVLIAALVVLGLLVACGAASVIGLVVYVSRESAAYERAEKAYRAPLEAFMGDGTELGRDPGAYIVKNRARISAARGGITAARRELGSAGDASDRSAYLETLAEVDVLLGVLEAMSPAGGPEALANEIERAASTLRPANDAFDQALDAQRSKKYEEMFVAATEAAAEARKAEAALATLDQTYRGLGIGDMRDHAAVTREVSGRLADLARKHMSGDKSSIQSARASLNTLNSKYDRALDRAVRSVAFALWRDPGAALADVLHRLEQARAEHEKVYQRIDAGE